MCYSSIYKSKNIDAKFNIRLVFFLIAILIISSVNYTILTIIFEYPIKYGILMFSSFITFLIYPLLSKLFDKITLIDLREENAN